MYKKLITACMALAAFVAFAVMPAAASAENSPELTHPTGQRLLAPVKLKATATNTRFTDTNGNDLVVCSNAEMTGELIKNNGSEVEGTITTSDFSGTGAVHAHNGLKECTGSFGNAWITVPGDLCVRSTPAMLTDEFQVTRGKCPGEGNVRFIIGSTTVGECEYEGTNPVSGHFKTHPEDAVMTVTHTQSGSGSKKIRGSFFCPGSGMLNMSFTLETDTGPTSDPIWIS